MTIRRFRPLLLTMVLGCAHGGKPDLGSPFSIALRGGPELRAEGSVAGQPAEVVLAVEEPRSRIALECFRETPQAIAQVRLPALEGGWETLPEVELRTAMLAQRSLPAFRAAIVPGGGRCRLWLGTDVLGQAVLDMDLDARTVVLRSTPPSLPKTAETVAVELTRAPTTDRLLVSGQLTGAAATVLQTLVLTTGRSTELAPLTARALGAEGLVRVAQLAPGWEACDVPVRVASEWTGAPAVGTLGPEGWGARRAVLDLASAHLTLLRPKDAPIPPCRPAEPSQVNPGSDEPEPR